MEGHRDKRANIFRHYYYFIWSRICLWLLSHTVHHLLFVIKNKFSTLVVRKRFKGNLWDITQSGRRKTQTATPTGTSTYTQESTDNFGKRVSILLIILVSGKPDLRTEYNVHGLTLDSGVLTFTERVIRIPRKRFSRPPSLPLWGLCQDPWT